MRRARMGADGIFVSRPGVDLDTAAETDLLLSPSSPHLRVSEAGSIVMGGKIKPPEEWSWLTTEAYYTGTIVFSGSYARPPIVLINLAHVDGYALRPVEVQAAAIQRFGTSYVWYHAVGYVVVQPDRAVVRTLYNNARVPTVGYRVFDMETSL